MDHTWFIRGLYVVHMLSIVHINDQYKDITLTDLQYEQWYKDISLTDLQYEQWYKDITLTDLQYEQWLY